MSDFLSGGCWEYFISTAMPIVTAFQQLQMAIGNRVRSEAMSDVRIEESRRGAEAREPKAVLGRALCISITICVPESRRLRSIGFRY